MIVISSDNQPDLPHISYHQMLTPSISPQQQRVWQENTQKIQETDIATIVYTSGTTGNTKGVMITHSNVMAAINSFLQVVPIQKHYRHIAYRTMSHIGGRFFDHYLRLKNVSCCYFCPDAKKLYSLLPEVRPQFFVGAPRIWEKLYQQISSRYPSSNAKEVLQYIGLDAIEIAISGAAPITSIILHYFSELGIAILEGYGQTESTGPISINPPEKIRVGTVGSILPEIDVQVAKDGELLIAGKNVAHGYFQQPDLTKQTFCHGWLHTGDLVKIDHQGYLSIVGRKKNILITSGGKSISPEPMESYLQKHPLVEQVCIIGDRRPYLTAIVSTCHLAKENPNKIAHIKSEFSQSLQQMRNFFSQAETIKKIGIVFDIWSSQTGELTSTQKVKRLAILEKYRPWIEQIYHHQENVVIFE
jgi:long-chain acyl-CoA synthetase